ncbi:hypothetical protein QYF36_021574 [Acer negundo]|nr:hypothetical protein QYF36_021574 [Acer negundo]
MGSTRCLDDRNGTSRTLSDAQTNDKCKSTKDVKEPISRLLAKMIKAKDTKVYLGLGSTMSMRSVVLC